MPKITVSLGMTLCTNPDTRNFIRIGIEAQEIDVDGDIEAQANASLVASLTVLKILDNGLKGAVSDVIIEEGAPGIVRDALKGHDEKMARVARVVQSALARITTLEEGIKHDDPVPDS